MLASFVLTYTLVPAMDTLFTLFIAPYVYAIIYGRRMGERTGDAYNEETQRKIRCHFSDSALGTPILAIGFLRARAMSRCSAGRRS